MTKGRKRLASDQLDQTQTKLKSRKSGGGEPTLNQGTQCSICNKSIVERSNEHDGEDAIYIVRIAVGGCTASVLD